MGQGIFRSVVTDTNGQKCIVIREQMLPALVTARIRPFCCVPENHVRIGILLRFDVHRLFDAEYMTLMSDYKIELNKHMQADFDDSENYLKLAATELGMLERHEVAPTAVTSNATTRTELEGER